MDRVLTVRDFVHYCFICGACGIVIAIVGAFIAEYMKKRERRNDERT